MIHESKLGHALKDMQQFLKYYQSRDETLQSILSKLDTLIENQERKMRTEIFGEQPLDSKFITNHIRGRSMDRQSNDIMASPLTGTKNMAQPPASENFSRPERILTHQKTSSSKVFKRKRPRYSRSSSKRQSTVKEIKPKFDASKKHSMLKNQRGALFKNLQALT